MPVRILALADTHLGIGLPARPRVERPRRGDDFFASFEAALAPAFGGGVDLVVHGGDLFYRSRIPAALASRVYRRLADLADAGVDVFWVPGNHERSGVPRGLLLGHPRVNVFDRPRTFVVERNGVRVALAGFPFSPRARSEFPALLAETGPAATATAAGADVRLLCLHQAVEGASVLGYVFRDGAEVVRGRDLPAGLAAVLTGHVHRHQVLRHDLAGRPLAAPVLYPGSTERTSAAERDDPKGFLTLVVRSPAEAGPAVAWEFHELPVRPMREVELDPRAADLEMRLRHVLDALPPRCVVRVRLSAAPPEPALAVLRAEALRALAPAGVEVDVVWGPWRRRGTADVAPAGPGDGARGSLRQRRRGRPEGDQHGVGDVEQMSLDPG